MNCVERGYEFTIKRERVRLNEPERIIRLRLNIYADNLKPGSAVADSRAPGATEKVKRRGLRPFGAASATVNRNAPSLPISPKIADWPRPVDPTKSCLIPADPVQVESQPITSRRTCAVAGG